MSAPTPPQGWCGSGVKESPQRKSPDGGVALRAYSLALQNGHAELARHAGETTLLDAVARGRWKSVAARASARDTRLARVHFSVSCARATSPIMRPRTANMAPQQRRQQPYRDPTLAHLQTNVWCPVWG